MPRAYLVPNVTREEVAVGARHLVSLEVSFHLQKATSKLQKDAFYAILAWLNQDVALVRPWDHNPVPDMKSPTPSFAQFDGSLLRRGFWVYVVEINSTSSKHYYVGRTGDTSSPFASSLFARLSAHLDQKQSAKGNSLSKRVREQRLDCSECSYRVIGIGPLFKQQLNMALHRPFRDQMAALESHLAELLRSRGYSVIGTHPRPKSVDAALLKRVLPIVDQHFPTGTLAGDSRTR
jgi:hypothetical protein